MFSLPFLSLWVFSQAEYSLLSVSLGSTAALEGTLRSLDEPESWYVHADVKQNVQNPYRFYRIRNISKLALYQPRS